MLAALIVIALAVSGCGDPDNVLTPPDPDIAAIQTVVIFPFVNDTRERELAQLFVDGLATGLREIGWYNVIDGTTVANELATRQIDIFDVDPDSDAWLETAREIALELHTDGFITGRVQRYDEQVTLAEPYRVENPNESPDDLVQWVADQTTIASATIEGKLVNAHIGATVYEKTVTGTGTVVDERRLNWAIDETPPANLIPSPHRRDVMAAQHAAIENVLHTFSKNILPRRSESSGNE